MVISLVKYLDAHGCLHMQYNDSAKDWMIEVRIPAGKTDFSFPKRPHRLLDSSSFLHKRFRGMSPGVKNLGLEAGNSLQSCAEVKEFTVILNHRLSKNYPED